MPLAVFIDTFLILPKRFKLGRSLVAKEANIDFDIDIESAFDKCKNALNRINAKFIRYKKPKYIIAIIGNSKFTIFLRRKKGNKSKANIICDNQWVTVIVGGTTNQKYLNTFLNSM